MPLLNAAIRRDVNAGPSAHIELGQVVVFAYAADLIAHLAAAGEDPVVGRGMAHLATVSPA